MIRRLVPLGVVLAAFLGVADLAAQGWNGDSTLPVPGTAEARQGELSRGLVALAPVETLKPTSTVDPSGTTVSVRQVRKGTGENQLWELRWEPGAPWGPGTWVAFRDGLGRIREIRILLLEGSEARDQRLAQAGTWLRLVPQAGGTSCRLDFFLAGRLVTGGWTVGATPVDILASDDAWLWEATDGDFAWDSLLPRHRWEDEKVEALRTRVHKALSTVPLAPQTLWWPDPKAGPGATTANGAPWGAWALLPGVEGEPSRGLGPWGVSLWVTEGVLRGWKAPDPTWAELLEPRIELPGYSRALTTENPSAEPAFGLDWIRNLGLGVQKALYPNRPRTDASADVQALAYLTAVPGAGYEVDDSPALWHLLAVQRPGQAYLASLSVQQRGAKGAPAAVTFGPPAVVFPWVGEDDRVRVVVYAGPQELTWDQWLAQVPGDRRGLRPDHLALTSLPLPSTVDLPLLPAR